MNDKNPTPGKDIDWIDNLLSKKIKDFIEKSKSQEKSISENIVIAIGSLIPSLGIQSFASDVLKIPKTFGILVGLSSVILYFLLYILFIRLKKYLIPFIKRIIGQRRPIDMTIHGDEKSLEYIRKFNDVIVNKILLASSFIAKAQNKKIPLEIREIACSEAMFYIGYSIDKINDYFIVESDNFEKLISFKKIPIKSKISFYRLQECINLSKTIVIDCDKIIAHSNQKKDNISYYNKKLDRIISKLEIYVSNYTNKDNVSDLKKSI